MLSTWSPAPGGLPSKESYDSNPAGSCNLNRNVTIQTWF